MWILKAFFSNFFNFFAFLKTEFAVLKNPYLLNRYNFVKVDFLRKITKFH